MILLISKILAKILAPSLLRLFFDKSTIFIYEANFSLLGSKANENKSASYFIKLHPEKLSDSNLGD
jgi:hypothetical protein